MLLDHFLVRHWEVRHRESRDFSVRQTENDACGGGVQIMRCRVQNGMERLDWSDRCHTLFPVDQGEVTPGSVKAHTDERSGQLQARKLRHTDSSLPNSLYGSVKEGPKAKS